MSVYDNYRDKQAEHSWQDSEERVAARVAEPLISKVGPGRNYYTPKQFRAMAIYLLEREDAEPAISRGSFKMGAIEFVSSTELREDRKATMRGLSKIAGIPLETLSRMLAAAGVPFEEKSGAKLYNIDDLRDYLGSVPKTALGNERSTLGPAGGRRSA